MSALITLLRNDFRLQRRYGIHAAYGAVIALYAGVIVAAGPVLPDWLIGVLIFSDPSVLGFFFLGGLMLLEKGEGVRTALAITPATARDYLLAKTITLTILALGAVAVLGLAKSGPVHWPLLVITVTLTSVTYIAIGTVIALRFTTINTYLIGSAVLLLPVILPAALAFVEPWPIWLGIVPPAAQLKLVLVALGSGSLATTGVAIALGVQLATTVATFFWAARRLGAELRARS